VRFDCARDVLWIEIQALLALESLAA
jgi:hypothetical protein